MTTKPHPRERARSRAIVALHLALVPLALLALFACEHAPPKAALATVVRSSPSSVAPSASRLCAEDEARRAARSAEIQRIVDDDQRARKGPMPQTPAEWAPIEEADRRRRMRVGEIFGEGCMTTAKDFANAALVYQHGDRPEHYLQAFFWASRAVALGDPSQKDMMALAIDRYLINTGKRQLFGSQASRPYGSACFCMAPVEASFPDEERVKWSKPLAARKAWIGELNGSATCPEIECSMPLEPTPRGSVPGLW